MRSALQSQETNLSAINRSLIEAICRYLGIPTKISWSWDYDLTEGKTERLVDLCRQAGATDYISGPAAKEYIDASLFADVGINLIRFGYGGFPTYPQLWAEFTHGVTILDLLFNCGPDAARFMRFV
jgi:hypothetical protein